MEINHKLKHFLATIPENVKLIAISKTKPAEDIMEAYNAGQRLFGENKIQELIVKAPQLPGDIQWHFVGHLQTNKVKFIAPFVKMIHAVDSLKLLKEINKHALKYDRVIDCLLQFHIAEETTKFGLNLKEADDLLSNDELTNLKNIQIVGVMGMATYTDDMEQVRNEFEHLANYMVTLKKKFFIDDHYFKEISMGMSGDYLIAIEEGSTMIRIGTMIFGEQNY
ncbi:MAG: YggS family pyridoxal phosphate-dependent enzyme [Bacteroidetes bacterium]|nr:YggS family pyridoxal phosphate-dependent enzyme [Bacteroidota bacterium]MBL6943986.1 YggS family pyridoxal phosphate-dependent enzyme [Bacteroidales bacterium]